MLGTTVLILIFPFSSTHTHYTYYTIIWCIKKDNLYYIAKSSAKYNSSSWIPAPYDKSQEGELLLTTGASSVFYKNNIADIAGNLAEWTLEYTNDSSKPCVYRGGENSKNGVETPANNRGAYGISGSSKNIGFRVTIF